MRTLGEVRKVSEGAFEVGGQVFPTFLEARMALARLKFGMADRRKDRQVERRKRARAAGQQS